jgi:hypothetical protein
MAEKAENVQPPACKPVASVTVTSMEAVTSTMPDRGSPKRSVKVKLKLLGAPISVTVSEKLIVFARAGNAMANGTAAARRCELRFLLMPINVSSKPPGRVRGRVSPHEQPKGAIKAAFSVTLGTSAKE